MNTICTCQPSKLCPSCLSEWLDYNARLDQLDADADLAAFHATLAAEESDRAPWQPEPEYSESEMKAAANVSAAREGAWGW